MPKALTFKRFQKKNEERCRSFPGKDLLEVWSLSDWQAGISEETGEIAGAIKRINRHRDGFASYDVEQLEENIGEEIADVITYLSLLATKMGFDLEEILIEKFNKVSEKRDSDIKL